MFSTISHNLEPHRWGSQYPTSLNHLHQGKITAGQVDAAAQEVVEITNKLSLLKTVTECFITSTTGRNLFELLRTVLQEAKQQNLEVSIEPFYEKIEADGSSSFLLKDD